MGLDAVGPSLTGEMNARLKEGVAADPTRVKRAPNLLSAHDAVRTTLILHVSTGLAILALRLAATSEITYAECSRRKKGFIAE